MSAAALGAREDFFGLLQDQTPWAEIERTIRALSTRGEREAAINLGVAELLLQFRQDHNVTGRFHRDELGPMSGFSFWLPAIFSIDGIERLLFVDARLSAGIATPLAYKFIFSMMDYKLQNVRDAEETKLAILQFPRIKRGSSERATKFTTHDRETDLFDPTALEKMIADTNRLWAIVQEERIEETKIKAQQYRETWWRDHKAG